MHGQLPSFKWAGQCIRNYETEVYKRNCESNGVYGKFCRVSVKNFLKKVIDAQDGFCNKYESLILAQNERWRQA